MMTIVKVASENPVKVEAIKSAFKRYFVDVEAIPYKVDSEVPKQPTNNAVFEGAEHRIKNLKSVCGDYDYVASCESGLVEQYGHWFNVQVVLVESKEGKRGFGVSQGYEVPDKYIEEILRTEMAEFLDKLFAEKGGTRILTRNQFTRKTLIQDGTIMALVGVLNGDIWWKIGVIITPIFLQLK